jgi:dTDP-4-dehydrorhamnose reductase
MQTVLVTGVTGFVGGYVVEELLRRNYHVVATARKIEATQKQRKNLSYQLLDFTDKKQVATVFSLVQPAVVVHCGALSKPDDCEQNKELAFETNVAGTACLLNEAARYKAQFVFLSTDFVFGGNSNGMYVEDDERAPVNYYGLTKVQAEDIVMQYAFDWTIIRTVLVYGRSTGERKSFIEQVVASLRDNKALNIFNDQVRTPTHVEDLAAGIAESIERKKTGIYHLSGKDAMTVYEAACQAAVWNGLDISLLSPIKEGDLAAPAKRPKITGFTISKAQKELNYQPVSFAEGLQKTFSF